MLTKEDIIKLYYGDTSKVLDPEFSWKNDAQAIGLNPEDYIIELETNELVNVFELYASILNKEKIGLNDTLQGYKEQIYGSSKLSELMIAPDSFDFYGNPSNRPASAFLKGLLNCEWANSNSFEYAKQFAQGDLKQPMNTELAIHTYIKTEKMMADEEMVKNLTEADISIVEWERAMIIKELKFIQREMSKELKSDTEVFITELMPKKFLYGSCVVYLGNREYLKKGKIIKV
jgi:hypothetical protein